VCNIAASLPQVLAVSQAIAATGLDFLLDVHGDEEIPANFIGSMFGVPAWGPRLERLQTTFTGAAQCLRVPIIFELHCKPHV
jgi:hypothetical protein